MELMEQDSFKKEQEKIISYIEEVLKNYLPKTPSYQKTIYDAMEYSVMAGGKRLRPMMMHQSYIMPSISPIIAGIPVQQNKRYTIPSPIFPR